jgi:LemA protein
MDTQKNFFQRNIKWIVAVVVVFLLVVWTVSKYNSFVRQNAEIDAQWAQVENQYQRRFDLIPNVVSTVKGFASHEQSIFDSITAARTQYAGATTPDQKAQAAGQVESALGRLLVIAESNPAITSAPVFQSQITELEGTENRVSVERMKYNDEVKILNAGVKVFPSSIIALIFGVKERAYFNAPTEAQTAPKVSF